LPNSRRLSVEALASALPLSCSQRRSRPSGSLLFAATAMSGSPPQRIMIVEILVTGGQAQHALGEQLAEGMLDKEGLACVAKTGGQAAGQSQGAVESSKSREGGSDLR